MSLTETHKSINMLFNQLDLSVPLLQALAEQGYTFVVYFRWVIKKVLISLYEEY